MLNRRAVSPWNNRRFIEGPRHPCYDARGPRLVIGPAIVEGTPAGGTGMQRTPAARTPKGDWRFDVSRRCRTGGRHSSAGIDLLMTEHGADMAEAPGGSTGLLVRQYQCGALAL